MTAHCLLWPTPFSVAHAFLGTRRFIMLNCYAICICRGIISP